LLRGEHPARYAFSVSLEAPERALPMASLPGRCGACNLIRLPRQISSHSCSPNFGRLSQLGHGAGSALSCQERIPGRERLITRGCFSTRRVACQILFESLILGLAEISHAHEYGYMRIDTTSGLGHFCSTIVAYRTIIVPSLHLLLYEEVNKKSYQCNLQS